MMTIFFFLFSAIFFSSSLPSILGYTLLYIQLSCTLPCAWYRFPLIFFRESITQLICFVARVTIPPSSILRTNEQGRGQKKNQQPVSILLVHGYLEKTTVWWWFRRELAKEQLGFIHSIPIRFPYESIENIASQLALYIRQSVPQDHHLLLIGHSMGGLVCSHYAEYSGPDERKKVVVAIGSPFQGTKMALFGRGRCAQQMLRDSSFLQALEKMREESRIPYLQIASEMDNMIIPSCSALGKKYPHATHLSLNYLGHMSLLFSSQVVKEIVSFFRKHTLQ